MLEEILQTKRKEIRVLLDQQADYPQHVRERAIAHYPFVRALRQPKHVSALIAEVKKASPSKGLIREDFDPVGIASQYEQGGADCLSVLTDVPYFQGHPRYIAQIKEHVRLPVLRKDFILEPVQIYESIALGADCILLIAKALTQDKLAELYELARAAGLDILIEVADKQELHAVLERIQPELIGINNRDLNTFRTDPAKTLELMPHIPEEVLVISESGIHSADTMRQLEQRGVGGFLIGEHLMRQEHIVQAIDTLYADTKMKQEQ